MVSVVTLIGIIVVTFFLARMTGNPAVFYLPEGSTPAMFHAFNRQHGYDLPLVVQFWHYLGDVTHLNFGQSLSQDEPASTAVLSAYPATLALAGLALAISFVVALLLGCVAAIRPQSQADRAVQLFSLTCASIPDFWFALLGVLIFAVDLRALPTSGDAGITSWVLPIATLVVAPSGALTQVVRGAMIEAMNENYVQNARARGFSRWRLVLRHALRNAALPITTVTGDRAVHLFNGTVIVSSIFAWPGVGSLVVNAVLDRDFSLIQASVFIVGVSVVMLNITVDLIYTVIDPRVRVS